jgi:hypothetical protein
MDADGGQRVENRSCMLPLLLRAMDNTQFQASHPLKHSLMSGLEGHRMLPPLKTVDVKGKADAR